MRKAMWISVFALFICATWAQTSWWCANESYRGYDNGWLQNLTTPDIELPAAPDGNLYVSFLINMEMEPPEVHEEYDGWDGFNIRISTDGGATFTPIEPEAGYDCASMYGFGYNGEGPDVPGFGGFSGGWVFHFVNLIDYVGETVQVRFVFGSDPMASTIDGDGDPSWYGVLVDNVIVQDASAIYYEDYAEEGVSEMVAGDAQEIYWEEWEISGDRYHSPEKSIWGDNEMSKRAMLVTPPIYIPDEFLATITYWLYCDLPDGDGDDDGYLEDYYVVYVSPDSGETWEKLVHDYARGACSTAWAMWETDSLFNGTLDLYAYIGSDVMIKFLLMNDDNEDGGVGEGMYLDDICVSGFYGNTYDAGASNVFMSPINLDEDITFNVEVTGYGVEIITPNVYYRMFDSTDTEVDWSILGSASVSFAEKRYRSFLWHPTAAGDYHVVAWTTSGADEDNSNDTVRVDFTVPDEHTKHLGYDDAVMDTFDGEYLYIPAGLDDFDEIGDGYGVDFEKPYTETHLSSISVKGFANGTLNFAIFEYAAGEPAFLPETTWSAELPEDGIDKELFVFELPEDYIIPFDAFILAAWRADTESYFLVGIDRSTPHDGHSWVTEYDTTYYDFFDLSMSSAPYNEFDLMIRCEVWETGGKGATLTSGGGIIRHSGGLPLETTDAEVETLFFEDFYSSDLTGWGVSYEPQVYWHITDDDVLAYDGDAVDEFAKPGRFALGQNVPNPFNPVTEIAFSISEATDVSIVIYDISGKALRSLVSGMIDAGDYKIQWNGTDDSGAELPSGIYFYRLVAGDRTAQKKMMLIR